MFYPNLLFIQSFHFNQVFIYIFSFSCPEYWWVAQSKFIGFGGQTLQDWRLNRTQAGGMGNPITLLPPTAQRSTYPTPHPQVARAPGADHLGLSSHSWIPPHGHYAYWRRKGWATPRGNHFYTFLTFELRSSSFLQQHRKYERTPVRRKPDFLHFFE